MPLRNERRGGREEGGHGEGSAGAATWKLWGDETSGGKFSNLRGSKPSSKCKVRKDCGTQCALSTDESEYLLSVFLRHWWGMLLKGDPQSSPIRIKGAATEPERVCRYSRMTGVSIRFTGEAPKMAWPCLSHTDRSKTRTIGK